MPVLSYFTGYYGIDWIGMLFIVMGIYYLGEKNKKGFLLGIVGCVALLIFSVLSKSVANGVLNTAMIILNIRAYKKWDTSN
ncbi:MAG: drug/metabolite transporter (DMT)-like permease [Candidatus Marinamargulisbacteria bacterium]|jgi:drug/metabolite transporter (DMT)-like permease